MSDYNTSTQTPALTYTFEKSAQIRNTSHLIFSNPIEGHIVFMLAGGYHVGLISRAGSPGRRLRIVTLVQLGDIVSAPNSSTEYARSLLIEHSPNIRQRILLVSPSINSLIALDMWPQGLQSLDANYTAPTLASLRC